MEKKYPTLVLNRLSERERGMLLDALAANVLDEPDELPERALYRRLLDSPGLFLAEIEHHELETLEATDDDRDLFTEKVVPLSHSQDTTTNS